MTAGVALAVLAALAVAWWLRTRRYRGIFRLPRRRDDRLVCRQPPASVALAVGPDGFELPAGFAAAPGEGTALLTLDVAATPAGFLREPHVEVLHDGVSYRQYFERGAAGRRYVDLSPLLRQRASGRVRLRGGSLRWKKDAAMITFDPPPLADARVLVLAPHPDDAEIAAFGLYAGHARSAWVVTVTAGEGGVMDLAPVLAAPAEADLEQARWKADLRVWDSLTIPRLAGVPAARCWNLVYPDRELESMFREPARPFTLACEGSLPRRVLRARNGEPLLADGESSCTWAGLIEELRRILETVRPTVVACPHPVIDVHPDHTFTTVALAEALQRCPGLAPAVLLYVVHAPGAPVHPCGPREGRVSLPPWTGEQWIADAIHSQSLPLELQHAKYFAVEAAHDLRAFGLAAPKTPGELLRLARRELSAFLGGVATAPTSFLRRAVRPNELYYVVSVDSLAALVKRRLDHGLDAAGPRG